MMRPPCGVLPLHQRIGALGAKEGAVEVDVDHRLPLLVGELFEGDRRRADAGVVEQQVEPAEGALHRRVKAVDRRRIDDVAGVGERAPAEPLDLARDRASGAALRPATATCQPAAASASAAARPMPRPPPVTSANLS